MAKGKKQFNAFGGVFTPSLLTILGVIMYLRLGWVVGNAGLWGAIFIVILAHVISVSTGLSISSIATDKKVGAGGVYYVLSRSLGLPIGGAIGLTLFIGTALSIALYIVGFSESFNAIIGLDDSINNIRLTGSIALLVLTIIAFISTSLAIKTQYFILAAIFISLVSIFIGRPVEASEIDLTNVSTPDVPLETVFAIFFPAVTGFTAGIAMSGDLKDPKKAIPVGTISAIAVGFFVYLGLVIFLGINVQAEALKSDYTILEKIAFFAPAVIAGIWGATLSSALGGILGGPRILQAMSLDKITPVIFGKEQGKTREPRFALIVAIIIAEGGILIGDLDIVARVVSMFYLAAYGFINISFFLESWASADFRPSFKVSKWIGFVGFLATFAVMFKLDAIAMFMALIIIGGIYLWLTRREIALGTGDIWRSVWSTGVKEGLKRLETREDHKRNWKPNILLFSGNSEARPYLIEFSQALAGRAGLVTNFDLIENPGMDILFTKHKQSVSDELLTKFGIFGRQLEVKNVYEGIETIASTFGFSGVDPNTVLMGWARNTKDPIWFARMTKTLIDLDYNVLYMDYDEKRGFGQRKQIDLWWRGMSNNSELMLQIAKFVSFNTAWRNARIRILLVNDFQVDHKIIENRIRKLLEEFRLQAEIKVIDNHIDKKLFYDILKAHSLKTDLVLIGIPFIEEGSESEFVQNTNELTGIIGTTLLVKASTTFDETKLGLKPMKDIQQVDPLISLQTESLVVPSDEATAALVKQTDQALEKAAAELIENYISLIAREYQNFIVGLENDFTQLLNGTGVSTSVALLNTREFVSCFNDRSAEFRTEELPLLGDILQQGIENYIQMRQRVIDELPLRLVRSDGVRLPWKRSFIYFDKEEFKNYFIKALKEFGIVSSGIVIRSKELIKENLEKMTEENDPELFSKDIQKGFREILAFSGQLLTNTLQDIRNGDHWLLNKLISAVEHKERLGSLGASLFGSNPGPSSRKMDFIHTYASFWQRNQQLFHHRFETGTELKRTRLILAKGTDYLFESTRIKALEPIHLQIVKLKDLLDHRIRDPKGKVEITSLPELVSSQYLMFDYLPHFRSFLKRIGKASEHLPSEVEMMDSGSEINIQDVQGKDVQTISFSIDKIADYIIETSFISRIQENLEIYNGELNEISGELINMVELLKPIFLWSGNENQIENTEKQLKQFADELDVLLASLDHANAAFEGATQDILTQVQHKLEVQYILDQAGQLKHYVRRQQIRKGIRGKLTIWRSTFNKQLLQAFALFSTRKESLRQLEFEQSNNQLKTTPDRLRSFLFSITGGKENSDSVPFYYRQLFSGKHLQSGRTIPTRIQEIEKIKSILRQQELGNVQGALMITGPSLSGKSFLTEHIANHYLSGSTYYINPAGGAASQIGDLEDAFTRATGFKGSTRVILQQCKHYSVFVFPDIEQWWLNRYGGDEIINHIVELIMEFGQRHIFILNANVHSLRRLKMQTRLDEVITSTILLRRLLKNEVRLELIKRHRIGGMDLYYRDRLIEIDRMDRRLERLFARIYKLSGGNIGFAYQIWLHSIEKQADGRYYLTLPRHLDFPDNIDPEWKSVLLQLQLHHLLNETGFRDLFEAMDEAWQNKILRGIRNSLILENPAGREIKLKKILRPYVEEWLLENELL